jgi:isohexenylglutaconyl-CoA hydratase
MIAETLNAVDSLRDDRSVRAIVLSGAGGNFCSGGDLKEMREAYASGSTTDETNFERLMVALIRAPQVVIAQVEGVAMGGGFGLACVADITIAADNAKMGMPEARLGLAPSFISAYVIQRIGLPNMRALTLTGRRITGAEALHYGAVNQAVPPDQLNAAVKSVLSDVLKCSPNALAACKALIFEVAGKPAAETVDYRANLLTQLRRSDDAQEGVAAFMERRPPRWAIEDGESG